VAAEPLADLPRLPRGQAGARVHRRGASRRTRCSVGSARATCSPTGTRRPTRELIDGDRLGSASARGKDDRLCQLHGALRVRADRAYRDDGFADRVAARGDRAGEPVGRRTRQRDGIPCCAAASTPWLPRDLRALPPETLPGLAGRDPAAARSRRSAVPAGTSGPNLGVVELTIALHRVFDLAARRRSSGTPATRPTCTRCSPAGHGLRALRQGRPVGYPRQAESEHDWWRTRTPLPHCPMRTGWPRRSRSPAARRPRWWWRSSATAR
jgi:hypothetical protein